MSAAETVVSLVVWRAASLDVRMADPSVDAMAVLMAARWEPWSVEKLVVSLD